MYLLARLVLSATIYFIWYERNNQLFNQFYRSHEDVCDEILSLSSSSWLSFNQYIRFKLLLGTSGASQSHKVSLLLLLSGSTLISLVYILTTSQPIVSFLETG